MRSQKSHLNNRRIVFNFTNQGDFKKKLLHVTAIEFSFLTFILNSILM